MSANLLRNDIRYLFVTSLHGDDIIVSAGQSYHTDANWRAQAIFLCKSSPDAEATMANSHRIRMRTSQQIKAPVLAFDLGEKRVGVAVSDKLLVSIRRLNALDRTNWKQLLRDITALVHRYDAQTVIVGLPLRLDGTSGRAALDAERTAHKLAQSLHIPVFLQDERLTSIDASERLRADGYKPDKVSELIDSESAVIILRDFIAG